MGTEAGLAPRPALMVLAFSPFPFGILHDLQLSTNGQCEEYDLKDVFYCTEHPVHLLSGIYHIMA